MNAGIEAVKITEESTSHHSLQSNAMPSKEAMFSTPNTNFSNDMSERYEETGNYLYATESAISSAGFPSQIEGIGYLDVDPRLPSFSNEQSDNTRQRISSDPHISIPADPPSYEESQILHESSKIVPESTESSVDDIEESSASESEESESGDEKLTDAETGENTINDSLGVRTELSSIVPPTSISLEITESHETDTALPDIMTEETSELPVKDTTDQIENEVAIENVNECLDDELKTMDDNNLHVNDNQAIGGNNVPDAIAKPNDRFITPIPITFETAATMDDVSDTELESYLQELEDLEEHSLGVKVKSDSIKSVNGSVKSDDIEACDAVYSINHTIESVSEAQQMGARDDRNADSFSQASTVEFGEVNATSSNELLPNILSDQNIESTSGIDSVLDAEPDTDIEPESTVGNSECQAEQIQYDDDRTEITSNLHTESAIKMEENVREQNEELPSELEHPIECSECELDQQLNSTAKRPNSLNLQNCNSTFVESPQNVASGSVLNFSSDDNAGNTPPASGQFLSSSISSDDSNITSDNNHMIVSTDI